MEFEQLKVAEGVNTVGAALVFVVVIGVCANIYAYFQCILPIIFVYKLPILLVLESETALFGSNQPLIITILFLYLAINLSYNYLMAVMVKPGYLDEYYCNEDKHSINQALDDKKVEKVTTKNVGGDLKILLKCSTTSIDQLSPEWDRKCAKCTFLSDFDIENKALPLKPLRFHHCSICKCCVLNMDHHCPWINNCVGFKNLRYFLLFLFYLWICNFLLAVLLFHCKDHPYYENYRTLCQILFGLHVGLLAVMSFFNCWQWYLCLKGIPQIEYLQTRINKGFKYTDNVHFDYGCKNCLDNLYVTFGTRNIFKVFLPSMRSLPLLGLEWTVSRINFQKNLKTEFKRTKEEEEDLEIRNLDIDLKDEGEILANELYRQNRIGNYKTGCIRRRLIGPDLWILLLSVLCISVPSILLMVIHIPLYENIWIRLAIEFIFLGGTLFVLFTLIDVGTSDPGIIPKSSFPVNKNYRYYIDIQRPNFNKIKLKICETCNIVRPPRSFHCRRCNACIEVHDHHCPWTGTCIGRRTHKKFVIFVISTTLLALIGLIIIIKPMILLWNRPVTDLRKAVAFMLIIYGIGVVFMLFFFGIWHIVLGLFNITTNERLRGSNNNKLNPFDYGNTENWRLFSSEYPSTPSSIYDLSLYLKEDEEDFYYSILGRYGKLTLKLRLNQNESNNSIEGCESSTEYIEYGKAKEIRIFNTILSSRAPSTDKLLMVN